MFRLRILWFGIIAAALFCAAQSRAQVLYGSLTGNVTDPSGAVVANATVTATNTETGVSKSATSNNHGIYVITDLTAGPYSVSFEAPGFGKLVKSGIPITQNAATRLDAQLALTQATQEVTVSAASEQLQTERPDVTHQLSSTQLSDLPETSTTGRNFESLFRLIPGFTPPAEQNSAAGNPQRAQATNVNGVANVSNNVQIDGANENYAYLAYLVAYIPPEDAIQTVNVVTNSFTAEQGQAGGSAVNVIIKSGTNQFHGAGWEYNTNSDFDARPYFFYGGKVAKNILNQFGADFGGPILKNKLFFFLDWERTMQRSDASGFLTLPNSNLIGGNFAGLSQVIYNPYSNPDPRLRAPFAGNVIPATFISPASAKLASLLPSPNQPGATTNNYFGVGGVQFNRDDADVKVDFHPTDRSSLFGRYSISKDNIFDPFQLGAAEGGTWDGGQPGNAFGTIQVGGAGGTYTFSPTVVMDGNVGYTRQRLGAEANGATTPYGLQVLGIPGANGSSALQGGIPYFAISGGWAPLGNSNTGNPFVFRDNNYTAALNLSWVKGTHSFRFGAQYIRGDINHFQPQGGAFQTARGSFRFTGGVTALQGGLQSPNLYNAWADYLLGLPNEEGKATQPVNPNAIRMSSYGFYGQDQWQATRNLTVTYGLRYEYYPFVTRDHYGAFRFDPTTGLVLIGGQGGVPENTGEYVRWANFAPRGGIAWRLGSKTVLRIGAGITIDPDNYRDMLNTYPALITTDFNPVSPAGSGYSTSYLPVASLTGYTPPGVSPVTSITGLPPAAPINLSAGKIPLPHNIGDETVPNPYWRGYIESYNMTMERDIGAGFLFSAGFVGTHEVRQMSNVNINAGPAGLGTNGRLLYTQLGLTADINAAQPFGTMRYDSLQTQLVRRVGDAQIGASYVYSRTLNFADNSTYNGLMFSYPTVWERNYALAGYDRTHNFELWTVYQLPFGPKKRFLSQGVLSRIIGGWQLNAVVTRTSGTPFTVQQSSSSLAAAGSTQTPNQVLSAVQIMGGHGPGQPYFNPAAFAAVTTPGVWGTVGRNTLRGPGMFEFDAGVFRNFLITERLNLQFRAESFAVTNTPIFSNPSSSVGANISGGSAFGTITATSGGNRVIRLGMKFSF